MSRANRKWAIPIGIGLAISPIHNQWLTNLTTTSNGDTLLFIPTLGAVLWFVWAALYLTWEKQKIDWGSVKILIPLLVIVASMGISGFVNGESLADKVSPLFMGIGLFCVYLASRRLGISLFRVLIPFTVASAIILVVLGIMYPGQYTGGLISNYCASAGYLIFGAVVNQGKWQWALVIVAAVGLFLTGSLEGVLIAGVVGLVVLVRRDVNKKLLIGFGIIATIAIIWLGMGNLTKLYEGNHNVSILMDLLTGRIPINGESMSALTSGRWPVIIDSLHNVKLFGHGYMLGVLGSAGGGTVHNLPLIILYQIGPLAAIAWTFVTVYLLITTKWKYAWVMILAMSFPDHYIWTQFTPLWWALAGVSSTSVISSDYIFKGRRYGDIVGNELVQAQ